MLTKRAWSDMQFVPDNCDGALSKLLSQKQLWAVGVSDWIADIAKAPTFSDCETFDELKAVIRDLRATGLSLSLGLGCHVSEIFPLVIESNTGLDL